MAKSDRYFQFPLAALYLNAKPLDEVTHDDKQKAIQNIICCSAVSLGESVQDSEHAYDKANDFADRNRVKWYDEYDPFHVGLLIACNMLDLRPGGLGCFRQAEHFLSSLTFGRKLVRLRTDLLWERHNDQSKSWREFAVLCAIYAGVGNKKMARLSYDQIRSMAMGFSGKKEYEDQFPMHKKDRRLTVRQTQWTVQQLHRRNLFAMASANGRHNHYSHRMSQKELVIALAEQIAKRDLAHKPRQTTNAIREAAAAIVAARTGRPVTQPPTDLAKAAYARLRDDERAEYQAAYQNGKAK